MKTLFAIAALAVGAAVCTPLVMAAPQSSCSSSKKAVAQSTCSARAAQTASATQSSGCPTSSAMSSLVKAVYQMEQAEGQVAGRENVVAALAVLIEANPQIAAKMSQRCNKTASIMSIASLKATAAVPVIAVAKIDAVPAASTCSGAKAPASNASLVSVQTRASGCCKAKAAAANASLVSVQTQASVCCKAKATAANASLVSVNQTQASRCCKATAAAANASLVSNTKAPGCSGAAPAATNVSFVAYGCDKSDAIARAAANGYLDVLCAMKRASGADGCPLDVAQKTLASVIGEMSNQRLSQAAPNANIQAVRFGPMAGCSQKDCSPECKAVCKALGIDCSTKTVNN